jgi:hypothetical protein
VYESNGLVHQKRKKVQMFDIASYLNASCENAKQALVKEYLEMANSKIADMIEIGTPMNEADTKEQFADFLKVNGSYGVQNFLFVCPEYVHYTKNRFDYSNNDYKKMKNAHEAWSKCVQVFFKNVGTYRNYIYEAKTAEELHEQAVKYAEETWAVWVNKMTAKLDGMNVNALETVGNSPLNNMMVAQCVNGLFFTVNNSIELVINEKGTVFNRFPCRFSTPMIDGKKVKGASSQKAIKELANA